MDGQPGTQTAVSLMTCRGWEDVERTQLVCPTLCWLEEFCWHLMLQWDQRLSEYENLLERAQHACGMIAFCQFGSTYMVQLETEQAINLRSRAVTQELAVTPQAHCHTMGRLSHDGQAVTRRAGCHTTGRLSHEGQAVTRWAGCHTMGRLSHDGQAVTRAGCHMRGRLSHEGQAVTRP